MVCTWKDCDEPATHSQIGSNGVEWANLCKEHNDMMEKAFIIGSGNGSPEDIKLMLSYYVKAQGGAKSFFMLHK